MDHVGPELPDGLLKRSANSEFLNKISQFLNIGLKFYSSTWDKAHVPSFSLWATSSISTLDDPQISLSIRIPLLTISNLPAA